MTIQGIRFIVLIPVVLAAGFGCTKKEKPLDLTTSPEKTELFGIGIISTNMNERDIAISPAGDEIIFTLSDFKSAKRCLVSVKKDKGRWNKKSILSFSGEHADIEPCFSPDGTKLYFASNRPVNEDTTRTDFNIWVSEKTSDGWMKPEPLPSVINTEKDEFYPSVSRNGTLYFTAERDNGIGKEDIFISIFSDGIYEEPVPLDSNINSATFEFNAYIHPDENLIIFSSFGREDDLGGGDLYYSQKDNTGKWLPAVNMGDEINSVNLDYCPFIDVPRNTFYFSSNRSSAMPAIIKNVEELESFSYDVLNGMGNIYRVNLQSTALE